jgi:biopolymer transport protein TolR
MGAQTMSRESNAITGINITPLVDVTLVLLIVLMVTANYLASHGIPLDLPKGATGEEIATTLAISVDKDGALFVDAQPTDDEGLRQKARSSLAKDNNTRAVIAADGRIAHSRVVKVMDILREEKVVRFAIQIDPEKARP